MGVTDTWRRGEVRRRRQIQLDIHNLPLAQAHIERRRDLGQCIANARGRKPSDFGRAGLPLLRRAAMAGSAVLFVSKLAASRNRAVA